MIEEREKLEGVDQTRTAARHMAQALSRVAVAEADRMALGIDSGGVAVAALERAAEIDRVALSLPAVAHQLICKVALGVVGLHQRLEVIRRSPRAAERLATGGSGLLPCSGPLSGLCGLLSRPALS